MSGAIMEATRHGLLQRVLVIIVLFLGFVARGAWAQPGDTDSVSGGTAARGEVSAQQSGEPQPANPTSTQQGETAASVAVSERSFEEGTVILPAAHLFGDWAGRLPAWEESGFKPTLTWLTNLAGNPVGGRELGFTECENLGLDLSFDLEKCQGICDTYFHVSMSQRSGTSLTNDYIGNVFSTQQVFGGETFKLVDLDVQRYFCDRAVDVRVGRIAAADDFLVSPFFWPYMSGGINGPAGIGINAPGWTSYANATWGTRIKARPSDRTYVMLGLYNGDPGIRNNDFHGCEFSMNGPLFAIAEFGYQRNGHRDDPGMLGNYKVGGYYNGGSYDTFNPSQFASGAGGLPPSTVENKWGYYALFDQVVFQPYGKDDPHAAGIFASIIVATDPSINQMPFFCSGGALVRGVLPSRPKDSIEFGAVYGKFSGDLQSAQQLAQAVDPTVGVQEYELVLEWAYRVRMRDGAMFFQPDLQYVVNPGGAHQYANALQVGAQAGVSF
jgi:porin